MCITLHSTMKRSSDRILTTHTGSLPRPADLLAMVEGHDQQDLRNNEPFERRIKDAVREIVAEQVNAQVDVLKRISPLGGLIVASATFGGDRGKLIPLSDAEARDVMARLKVS